MCTRPTLLAVGIATGAVLLSARLATDPAPALGCTAFVVRDGSNVRVGKNLDWPVGLGAVLVNPRGLEKSAWVDGSGAALSWVSRYASLTFNQLGREFPLGGMNEAGLVVEELSYGPARYPDPGGSPVVTELQWIQYQLDRHGSVQEVVADTSVRIAPFLFGLHYLVADAAGGAAVIEFLEGTRVVYTGEDLPVAVLANDSYRNLVRYLGHHVGFGGDRRVGRGSESPERFVRAATAVRRIEAASVGRTRPGPDAASAAFDSAFAILDDVDQEDTQWSIVYDPVGLEVRWRTRGDPRLRSAELDEMRGGCGAGVVGSGIAADGEPDHWLAWDSSRNERLILAVFAELETLGIPDVPAIGIRRSLIDYSGASRCALDRIRR